MGFTAKWYIEPQVVLVTYSGVICLEDVEASMLQTRHLSAGYPSGTVHTLADMTQVEHANFKLLELRDRVGKMLVHYPLEGWIIVVLGKSTGGLRLMLNTVGRYFGVHFRIFDTSEEAVAFISQMARKIHPNG